MKKSVLFIMLILLSASLLAPAHAASLPVRGVWVSSVFNLDFPSRPGLGAESLCRELDAIVENAVTMGLTDVFFQARPCADALYPSALFPWSEWLTGQQGQAPEDGFDPLSYLTEKCHEAGLRLHCWINPYRVSRQKAADKAEALSALAENNPAALHPEWVVLHSDGCLYFDPGLPEVRALILDGVREILDRYEVDGVHFDDYFYPSSDFEDEATRAAYGADLSAGDYRREAVNAFVREVHELTRERGVVFGVSPFGIWANRSSLPEGSDTIGGQSYFDHYADSRLWVREGLVDYIAPQLYWAVGSREGEFETLLRWWKSQTDGTGVKLYVGQAPYRMTDAEPTSVWYGTGELARQFKLMEGAGADGSILFRYGSLIGHRPLYWFLRSAFAPSEDAPALHRLSAPVQETADAETVIAGSSDRRFPLFLNGQQAETTENGFYRLTVPRGSDVWLANGPDELHFVPADERALPVHQRITDPKPQRPSCPAEAPAEALGCSAVYGGKVIAFTDAFIAALTECEPGSYSAEGSPDFTGRVLYTCEKNGVLTASISPAGREADTPRAVVVKADHCMLYDESGAIIGDLRAGMTASVTGWRRGCARTPLGWIDGGDVELIFDEDVSPVSVTDIRSSEGAVTFRIGAPCAAAARMEGGDLILDLGEVRRAFLFESPLFSSVRCENGVYRLTPSSPIGGYDVAYADGTVTLTVRPLRDRPVILIEAAFGGDETGRQGLEIDVCEKDLDLRAAFALREQLQALGFDMRMTREDDRMLTGAERAAILREASPDLAVTLRLGGAEEEGRTILSGSPALCQCVSARLSQTDMPCETAPASDGGGAGSFLTITSRSIVFPEDYESLSDDTWLQSFCAAVAQGVADSLKY